MRIGILGGAFNPIHFGHLVIASEVKHKLKLDKVIFVPSGKAPHKEVKGASPRERYKMVSLAIKGNPFFAISSIEIDKSTREKRPIYTLETIQDFLNIYKNKAKIYFIVGSDEILKFSTWKEPDRLLRLCKFVVVTRPGYSLDKVGKKVASRIIKVNTPGIDISSSEIRKRIRVGKPVTYLVPPEVEKYIRRRNLYL